VHEPGRLTAATSSSPDLVVGLGIFAMNLDAARDEQRRVATAP
jgi:hypothetical protein